MSQGGAFKYSDFGYSVQVPGNSQAPVSGFQFPAQALGCVPQIGGSVRIPPYTGPLGPWIWYGDGGGVGSAAAGPTCIIILMMNMMMMTNNFIA
jgi:hypothetical protein